MTTTVAQMDFYNEFQCSGDKCEFNCCNSWTVVVDEETMQKYVQLDTSTGSSIASNIITTDLSSGSKQHSMKLREDNYCSVLTPEGLCSLVSDYGPELLCKTCAHYPRSASIYSGAGHAVAGMKLSCSEAARLALLREAPLGQITTNLSDNLKAIPAQVYTTSDSEVDRLIYSLRSHMIKIMQYRSQPISKRITALLLLASSASKKDIYNQKFQTEEIVKEASDLIESKLAGIPELPSKKANQFLVFLHLVNELGSLAKNSNITNSKINKLITESLNGLNISNLNSVEQSNFDAYLDSYERHIRKFEQEKSYIIENMIVHHLMLSDAFFDRSKTPLESLISILSYLILIRGLSHGYANKYGRIDEEMYINLIYVLHRAIEHNPERANALQKKCMEVSGMNIGQLSTFFL